MNELNKTTSADKERRVAPRYKISLKAPVLITAITGATVDKEQYFVLRGQTLDVSISGLALIIPNSDWREIERLGRDCLLRLLLPLPSEAIELEVSPVRFQLLNESERGEILVGTHIINMKGRDRILFMEFVRDCEAADSSPKS